MAYLPLGASAHFVVYVVPNENSTAPLSESALLVRPQGLILKLIAVFQQQHIGDVCVAPHSFKM